VGEDARLVATLAAIDAANAADPHVVDVDGRAVPKELAHADAVERWVRRLVPEPDDLQLIAARGHHLRRWVVPRSDYPEGRAGYLRWRTDHKKRQAAEVAEIMVEHGYGADEVERVASIVSKRGLGSDPAAQVHEDALCLAFLELQFDPVADQLGDERTIEVLRKTIRKMSAPGIELAGTIPVSASGAALLAAALER
jgi:hypothetical protein